MVLIFFVEKISKFHIERTQEDPKKFAKIIKKLKRNTSEKNIQFLKKTT